MKEFIDFEDPMIIKTATDEEIWDAVDYEDLLPTIVEEANENVSLLSNKLITLEQDPSNKDLIDALFRSAHNLKGLAKLLNIKKMILLCKCMENILDGYRNGALSPDSITIDLLLESNDILEQYFLPAIENTQPISFNMKDNLLKHKQLYSKETKNVSNAETLKHPEPNKTLKPVPIKQKTMKPVSMSTNVLKVNMKKLDSILNMVGELVIGKSRFESKISEMNVLLSELNYLQKSLLEIRKNKPPSNDTNDILDDVRRFEIVFSELSQDFDEVINELSKNILALQENIMKARMIPIETVFEKIPRMVRDLSKELKKEINLEINGQETEVDKILAEKLSEPLMHLIRNAVDHGIETPEERKEKNKNPKGRIKLNAFHSAGQLVVVLEDDGKGLNIDIIKRKAIEKKLYTEKEINNLPPENVTNIIFHPGFSTSSSVTDISGRGVGLDVVRVKLNELKGAVSVSSQKDIGTTFKIQLPLTLAVINVLLIKCNSETFAIPISSINETIYISKEEIKQIGTRTGIKHRGNTLFIYNLDNIITVKGDKWLESNKLPMIVIGDEGYKIGIVVDKLLEKKEVVVKSLGSYLGNVKYAMGATISGDGKVIIIIDINKILENEKMGMLLKNMPDCLESAREDEVSTQPKEVKQMNVLVVEDSPAIRKKLVTILNNAGYKTIEAENGAVGLKYAKKTTFDVITTDIVMPIMDGYQFTQNVRKLAQYKRTPIIMITSKSEKLDRVKGFDAGADDYITKPFNSKEILDIIAENLSFGKRL